MTLDRLDHLLKCNTGMLADAMARAKRQRRIDEAVRAAEPYACVIAFFKARRNRPWFSDDAKLRRHILASKPLGVRSIRAEYRLIVKREENRE